MQPGLPRQLGMERHGDHVSLTHRHRMAVDLGEHLDLRAALCDPRGADEDGVQRPAGDAVQLDVGLE